MSIVKPRHHDDTPPANDVNWAFGTEEGIEQQDYELDEILRKLTLSQWFATVEERSWFWLD